ncbi:MAG: hypothetical protein J7M40_11010 [Planctomycetes bacterium]|nr:hypothetical protein [Planctomycetota bacterium]
MKSILNGEFKLKYFRHIVFVICVFGAFFAAGGVQAEALPGVSKNVSLVDEFARFGLAPKSQGRRDTCSLFAITALAGFEYARHTPAPHGPLCEEFLVWAANEATGRKGDQAMFYEAVVGLNTLGICKDALMPYALASDSDRRPSAATLTDAGMRRQRWRAHWIKRWDIKRKLSDVQLAVIKKALARSHPVACGLRWPKKLKGDKLLDVPPARDVFDGHSIVLVGCRKDASRPGGGVFQFRNSKGRQWGNGGYGLISYAYVRAYANDALWIQLGAADSELPIERFEAEDLSVLAKDGCVTASQGMNKWGAKMWSQGKHLFCRTEKNGFLEVSFAVRKSGRYRVRLLATAAPDYGTIGVTVDGKKPQAVFDLYSGRVCPSGSLELGIYNLPAGRHRIRFTAAPKNSASSNLFFGIDTIDLLAPGR